MKLGLSIGYSGAQLNVPVALVQRAEELGYDSVWTAEAYGSDAVTPLAYLAANPGLALSRRQLLDGVWGEGWYGDERTVDVHVRQLRKKLGDELPLTTVWGVGYRLG